MDIQNQKLVRLEIELASIKSRLDSISTPVDAQEQENEMLKNVNRLQAVPNYIAELSFENKAKGKIIYHKKEGYIWIGDYDVSTSRWDKVNLFSPDTKRPFTGSPNNIKEGDQFSVKGNLVLKEKKPVFKLDYFTGTERKGIIPDRTMITVLEKPVRIRRENKVLYWVRVRVEQ